MADEYRVFGCLVPAGTPAATPITIDISFPARQVTNIHVRIPPGPAGTTGFALGAAGQQVLPSNAGAWLIGDNEYFDWPVEGEHNSGSWQFFGYNTGLHDHTIYLTFALALVGDATTLGTLPALSTAALSQASTTDASPTLADLAATDATGQ